MFGGIPHGTDLDIGRAGRNADHHADRRSEEIARHVTFLIMPRSISSVALKSAITPSFSGRIVLMFRIGLLMHPAGLRITDSHQFTGVYVQRHDGRLVHHDLPVVNNQSIGRTQVDSQLLCQ